ncbi:MAG TPA: dockerin type I domain-containing protein [candidate division Zixibacteria bacterium]|nr:dockerin type I domain-containing protein [candidate division Zixibacteria bacterium]
MRSLKATFQLLGFLLSLGALGFVGIPVAGSLTLPFVAQPGAQEYDPGIPDTLRVGYAIAAAGQQFVAPVYFFCDEELGGIQIVLSYDQSQLVCDSVSFQNTTLPLGGKLATIDSAAGVINAGIVYLSEETIPPQSGRFGDVYLSMTAPPHADTFLIDSTSIVVDTITTINTIFSQSNPAVTIFPQFVPGELVMVGYVPGDGDASGRANIGDATFLISFIFAGGPAPLIPAAADANADCSVNIADVSYLIQYIFNSGPAPELGCAE